MGKDLIHTVLCAVEENWLNQAPKPHLDKVAALQAVDSDPELENSERSTSEADYVKNYLLLSLLFQPFFFLLLGGLLFLRLLLCLQNSCSRIFSLCFAASGSKTSSSSF